jgi:Tfp pilus assembly protein PilV
MSQTRYLKGECEQCAGHIEFPVEAVGTTIQCPHCGQQTDLFLLAPKDEPSLPRAKIVWTIIAVVVLTGGLIGALAALKRARNWAEQQQQQQQSPAKTATTEAANPPSPTPEPASPSTQEDPVAKANFQVSAINLEKTSGSKLIYAVGTVTNTADKQRFGVKIEIELLDAAGQKIGTAKDYQAVIEPKASWRFKALVVDPKADSAKLGSIKEDQ